MKVLHIINSLHKGGAEAHLLMLMKGFRERGVDGEVAFLRQTVPGGSIDLREQFEEAGIPTHYLACESPYDVRSAPRLNHLLTRGYDILHSHLPRADAAAAVCKVLRPRQTWVSTIHGPYNRTYASAVIGGLVPWMSPIWKRADGIIAVSKSTREWCVDRLGLRASQITTIPHGIELDPLITVTPPEENRWSIGSIGRYEEPKGHEVLIRAMPRILEEFPAASLHIAGHDPWGHGEVLRRTIRELSLGAHVHLVGFMTDRHAFFSNIDVFALASRWEGFGIVVLEAMEAGKPVVVSDIPALMELVAPGDNGLVCPRDDHEAFASAVTSLFRHREWLRVMGERGRLRVVKEYSQAGMVERTLCYYEDVLRARAAETPRAVAVPGANYDAQVVEGFGSEWGRFDQRNMSDTDALTLFQRYFANFPWNELPPDAAGFDAGCGSGRWARLVAPRVGTLHCVDASQEALRVARRNLAAFPNCQLHLATVDSMALPERSLDFGYSLGVLHHIPDTLSALRACVRALKPGAPLLLYLYYSFENRPRWFPKVWKVADVVRVLLSRCPFAVRNAISGLLALFVYWPLARTARLAERLGLPVVNIPLSAYRDVSFYVMQTDALDRFGTRLEKRFTRDEIRQMMEEAGLRNIQFNEGPPYWVVVGRAAAAAEAGQDQRIVESVAVSRH